MFEHFTVPMLQLLRCLNFGRSFGPKIESAKSIEVKVKQKKKVNNESRLVHEKTSDETKQAIHYTTNMMVYAAVSDLARHAMLGENVE